MILRPLSYSAYIRCGIFGCRGTAFHRVPGKYPHRTPRWRLLFASGV